MAYPEDSPLKDPVGFLTAEIAELDSSMSEAIHTSCGHRHVRRDHCNRLLQFAIAMNVSSDLIISIENHLNSINP